MSVLSEPISEPQSEPATASAPDLTGSWDGSQHASRNDDWGDLNVKATPDGYIGTYSGTFNKQLGSITFKSTTEGRYHGLWWESNLKRYGSLELAVSKDANSLQVEWKALSGSGGAARKSIWKKK